MKIPTPQEIQAILDALPVDAQNWGVQRLIQWMHENSVEMQPMHYTLPFTAVVAATTAAPQQIKIDSAAPFMLISQQYFATPYPVTEKSVSSTLVASATVLITDLQSGRNWQDSATPVPNIFGTAERPYYYPQPRLMAANSALSVTLANIDSADDVNVYLTFSGYRFYQGN